MAAPPATPRAELHALIAGKLQAGMSPAAAADAIIELFWVVTDDWTEVNLTGLGDQVEHHQLSRELVARVVREHHDWTQPACIPARSVTQ